MEGLKRQIRYQLMDSKRAFIMFWGIVILVNILFYILNATSGSNTTFGSGSFITTVDANGEMISTRFLNVAGGNILAIAIFLIVYCIVMYYESFPTAIGFSSTRKNFYLGVVVHNIILCFTMAVVEGILLKLDRYIIRAIGELPLNTFLMFDLENNNILFIIAVLFLVFLLVCSVFNFLGVVLYKFGYKFWIGFAIVSIVLSNIVVDKPILKGTVDFLSGYNGFASFFIKVLIEGVILYGLGWMFIRHRSIRSGK
jgi:hypothetical protein